MEYFWNCLCTFVKFLALDPNLIPKHLPHLFVNVKISKSSIRRHFTISRAQRRPTNLLSNSKANTEELVQTVTGLLFTFPTRHFSLGERLLLYFLAIFINSGDYICKLMQMLAWLLPCQIENKEDKEVSQDMRII